MNSLTDILLCDHLLVLLKPCWSIMFFIELLTVLVTNVLPSIIKLYFLSQLLEGNILCELSNNFHSQKPKKKSIIFLKIWINQKFQIMVCACSDISVWCSFQAIDLLKHLFYCSNIFTFSWVGKIIMGTYLFFISCTVRHYTILHNQLSNLIQVYLTIN